MLFLGLSLAIQLGERGVGSAKATAVTAGVSLFIALGAVGGAVVLADASHAVLAGVLAFGAAALLYLVTEEDAEPAIPGEPEEPDEAEALVTVGRYFTPWEAHLARTYLESEGIDAIVLEERLPGVSLLTGEPAALTRLEVHPADAERAQEILAEVEDVDEATE